MKVLPEAKVQTLSECKPGQLVRDLADPKGRLHVVCGMEEASLPGLIYLADGDPRMEPGSEDVTVLTYRGALVWEIDQASFVEPYTDGMLQKSGCVICSEQGWLMNVVVATPRGLRTTSFNIITGQLVPHRQLLEIAIFGAWSAFLEDEGRPFEGRIKMASFDAQKSRQEPL